MADPVLDVRVLGASELSAGGVPVPLDRPLERALAVRLALARGAGVPDDILARDLWGEAELARPAERLRVLASRLRRALGGHAAAVSRTAAGFALDAHPVDLTAAEDAITRAQAARRGGDAGTAQAATAEALAQWRGPALADLRAIPFAGLEGERLDALRLDLQVEWIEGELAAGSTAVGSELERLVGEHPLHERLVGLSALTLYRAGRQAEALDRLARLRQALADELGVDPAPETADLELQLLRQDPALRVEPPTPAPATAGLPELHWGPAATSFVGRDGEHASLQDLLTNPNLVTLTGGPGAGKTRLAQELAAATQRSGRPVAWLDLAPLASAEAIAPALAAAVNADPGPGDPIPRCLDKLAGALLVVDNAEHLVDGAAALVGALRRGAGGLSVLVTSQRALRIAGEELHQVGPLPPHAARSLFRSRSGNSEADDARVDAICAAVDRLPLAIELAAGLTRTLTVAQIANRIDDRLRLLVGGPRDAGARHTSLRSALDWSHDLLDQPARVVLRRLAVFVAGCTLEVAEQVVADGTDIAAADVVVLLGELADRCLITVDTRGAAHRFGLLETVRDYAADQLRAAGEEQSVRRRHADWCLRLARKSEQYGGQNHAELLRELTTEEANIRAALEWALGPGGEPAWAMELVAPSWWYWWTRGLMAEARDWLRRSLAATDPTPSVQRSYALRAVASLTRNSGEFAEARELGEVALAAAHAIGDDRSITAALLGLSITDLALRDFDTSLAIAEQSRDRAVAAGNDRVIGAALNLIGLVLRNQGRIDEAEQAFDDSLQKWLAIDDRRGVAGLYNTLAIVARMRGNLARSRELLLESLVRYRDLQLAEGQLDVLEAIACLEIADGNHETALRLLTVAQAHRDRLGAPLFVPDEIADRDAAEVAARQALGADADWIASRARTLPFEPLVEEMLARA